MRRSDKQIFRFPSGGLDEDRAKADQERGTTQHCLNVRAFDHQGRQRGGQRPGFDKYSSAQVNSTNRVQCITHAVSVQTGSASQNNLSLRTIKLLAVANGTLRIITPSASTAPSVHTGMLDADAPFIAATAFGEDVYFQDGTNHTFYDNLADDLLAVSASAGTLPASGGSTPRLSCVWGGRYVVSGIATDPQNWFMSAVNDPTNWDYSPTTHVETMAVAGNSADAGKTGDTVNCLLPYNNDLLWIGCDHHIWQLTGNPLVGGRFDLVSDTIGMAWGRPFCKDDRGGIFFMSSRGAIYRMNPGEAPQRITAKKIEERLASINMDTTVIRMAWDDQNLGVHVWVTPLTATTAEHWYYEVRSDGWFPVRYGSKNHNPVAVHVFDGDAPEDRAILFGTETGYIMKLNDRSFNDDGTAIESTVRLGPIMVEDGKLPFLLKSIQIVLESSSSDVTYEIIAGDSAESAFGSPRGYFILTEAGGRIILEDGTGYLLTEDIIPLRTGTMSATRSRAKHVRTRGFAIYIDISNSTVSQTWSMERLIADLSIIGTSRGRRL